MPAIRSIVSLDIGGLAGFPSRRRRSLGPRGRQEPAG